MGAANCRDESKVRPRSDGHLHCRVARGVSGTAPFGSTGRPPTGFWHSRWCACEQEELRKSAVDAVGRELSSGEAALPGKTSVSDLQTGEAQLRIGEEDQPGPAIGLFGMAHTRTGPIEHPFGEAVGVLQVEAAHICPPRAVEAKGTGAAPPEPEY